MEGEREKGKSEIILIRLPAVTLVFTENAAGKQGIRWSLEQRNTMLTGRGW